MREAFALQKLYTFFQPKILAYLFFFFFWNFNVSLTNDRAQDCTQHLEERRPWIHDVLRSVTKSGTREDRFSHLLLHSLKRATYSSAGATEPAASSIVQAMSCWESSWTGLHVKEAYRIIAEEQPRSFAQSRRKPPEHTSNSESVQNEKYL